MSNPSAWVVLAVGCIECQEATTCLGVFSTRAEAEEHGTDDPPYHLILEVALTDKTSDDYWRAGN